MAISGGLGALIKSTKDIEATQRKKGKGVEALIAKSGVAKFVGEMQENQRYVVDLIDRTVREYLPRQKSLSPKEKEAYEQRLEHLNRLNRRIDQFISDAVMEAQIEASRGRVFNAEEFMARKTTEQLKKEYALLDDIVERYPLETHKPEKGELGKYPELKKVTEADYRKLKEHLKRITEAERRMSPRRVIMPQTKRRP